MERHADRRQARADMLRLADRLVAEFAGALPAGAVLRCVSRVYADLLGAGIRDDLARRAEPVVRAELSGRLPAHAPLTATG